MNRNRYTAEDAESSNDTQAGSSSLVEEEEETEEGWTQGEILAKIKTLTLYRIFIFFVIELYLGCDLTIALIVARIVSQ